MKNKKIVLIAAGVILVVCCLIGVVISIVFPSSEPAATNTPKPTATLKPTQTIAPTKTPEPLPGVPGLSPFDLKLNLEERKFQCTDAEEISDEILGNWFSWTCSRDTGVAFLHVEFFGKSLTVVDSVDATISQFTEEPSDDLAAEFLGFVATAAFLGDSEKQNEVKDWIKQTLPTLTDGCIKVNFYGIDFRLCGPPTARWIEYGELD